MFLLIYLILKEVREGRNQMDNLTNKWYKEVRAAPSESESDEASEVTHH